MPNAQMLSGEMQQSEERFSLTKNRCCILKSTPRPERVVLYRYKARGINVLAAAANEIECEQIITLQDERWASYVWRRGSVPLRWSQTVKPNGVGTAIAIEGDRTFSGSRRSALVI
jgi:SacI homology domain